MPKKLLFITLLFFSFVGFSQLTPPTELQDYYSDIDFSETGNDLYTALATKTIAKHTTFLSYSDRHDYLYDADEDPTNENNVVLIYSGEIRADNEWLSSSNPNPTKTYNTEHVFPRSLLENSNCTNKLNIF
ncbi:hypothetical protein N9V96_03420 [Polaribacter sp.]|nr:hypothetical protein [Polaribacter sp.]